MSRDGAQRIAAERRRQIEVEGYTPDHDATHDDVSLAEAAVRYAVYAGYQAMGMVPSEDEMGAPWPWEREAWKPSDDPVRNLEKAGALIAAEIDRLLAGQEQL